MASLRVPRPGALFIGAALALMLGACGGGGGGSVSTPSTGPGSGTVQPPGGSGSAGSGTLSFVVTIPSATTTASNSRTPKYVSPSTASISVTLAGASTPLATENLSAGAPGCTTTAAGTSCTVTVTAPAGSQTFNIATYDGPNGTGHQLSIAKVPASITASSTTSIPLALQGVVASVTALLGSSSVPVGAAASVSITIVAYDANNNIIVGPGNFSSPVTLALNDPSGNTTLSTNTVPAPGTSVSLNYNGNSVTAATVTPSINGTPGTAATFAPSGDAVTNFTTPGQLGDITAMAAGPGSDGNVWFAAYGCCESTANIGKISPGGAVTAYSNNTPNAYIDGLAPSSDGMSLWFGDEDGDVGRISTSGTVTYASSFNTPCESETTTCGEIDYMVLGPDGNVWFGDCDGYVGNVTPAGVVTEYDPTQLPGWTGSYFSPEQIAFGPDGKLYTADESDQVEQITLSGDVPSAVAVVPDPADCEVYGLAIGTDGNPWFANDCEDVGMVPAGNFTQTSALEWSIAGIDDEEDFDFLIGSPGGLWATDDEDGNVYQIGGLSGVSASQGPSLTPVAAVPFSEEYLENLGPDNNLWVATDGETPVISKVIYGAQAIGTLSSQRGAGTLSTKRASASISHVKHRHSRHGRGRGPHAHSEMHGHPRRPKPTK